MIQVAKPLLGKEELKKIGEVLETGWLGMGDRVFQFENELKKMMRRRYAISVNTGTNAIHLALDSVGIKPGDEVIVPSLTYAGTIQPIIMCGAKPVFCDINTEDLNMDIDHAKSLINRRTKAVIPVHYGGQPCDIGAILKIAVKHRLRIVEDAAHAFGSKYGRRLIGSFGDLTCFSFDPIKNITCGEGGVILTDDRKTADIMVKKRILGIDKDTWNRYKHRRSWSYEVQMKGYRYHMSNINAAVGLVQLSKMEKLTKIRRGIAEFYGKELKKVDGVKLLRRDCQKIAPFNYTIFAEKRDELMEFLKKEGVGTVINYIPNHLQPAFKKRGIKLPKTEYAYERIVSIPMHSGLTMGDARQVVSAIKEFYAKER